MTLQATIDKLVCLIPELTPQVRKAATFVLDNPAGVATMSMRQLASKANVPPPTMARLAKAAGFETYNDLRSIYQTGYHQSFVGFPDRARQLQKQVQTQGQQSLWDNLCEAALDNLDTLYRSTRPDDLIKAADLLINARTVYVMGMLSSYSFAHYCHYVGQLALPNLRILPAAGGVVADQISDINEEDLLIAIAYQPYSRNTVGAVQLANSRGTKVIAITDTLASPIARGATNTFVTPIASPQYFSSFVATTALIEALLAQAIAQGGEGLVDNITRAEQIRDQIGEYWNEDEGNT